MVTRDGCTCVHVAISGVDNRKELKNAKHEKFFKMIFIRKLSHRISAQFLYFVCKNWWRA